MKRNTDTALLSDEYIRNEFDNIAGMAVVKNDAVVYERYFNGYTADDPVHVASVTKSVVSALIGIAIDQGYISGTEQKVLDFFPGYAVKRGEQTIQNVTIAQLLTMTAPYKYKSEPYTKVYGSGDWTKAALDLLGGKRGIGAFTYSTVGTHILSGILVQATGVPVRDFAASRLFAPLGIQAPPSAAIRSREEYTAFLKDKGVSGWIADPKGTNTGGWGLALTLRDMIQIGRLYLNNGARNGAQIVSPQWIAESTRAHSRRGTRAYGYLWWIIEDGDCPGYAALGDGGNVIFVAPRKRMAVMIASRFKPRAKDRIEWILRDLIPPFAEGVSAGRGGQPR